MGRTKTVFLTLAVLLSTVSAQMTWTCATESAPWGPRSAHASVVFDNKMWVLGGALVCGPPEVWANDVWCSTNGVDWTCLVDSAPWSERCPVSVVFDNKIWVLGGYRNASGDGTNDVWYSSDGANWTCATASAGWSPRGAHSVALFDNKMWVVAGLAIPEYPRDVWWSTDGANWICATDTAPWPGRSYQGLAAFDNKLWLMGGFTGVGGGRELNDIWTSTDGVNWTCAADSADWSPRDGHALSISDDTMWLTGGSPDLQMGLRLSDAWYSTDGVNWTCAASSAQWLPRMAHSAVAYDSLLWIMGGDTTASSLTMSDVWYSSGLGVEESHQPQASSAKLGPTVLSGASSVKRLAACDIFDAMGRRTASPKPGVYFVREAQARAQAVRKVVVAR